MNYNSAYGGLIIAQAVNSATETVETDFKLNSLHCYFIRSGSIEIPDGVRYEIERLRDGKSYCTRSIRAIQGKSDCIFTMIVSFHRTESDQPTFFKGFRQTVGEIQLNGNSKTGDSILNHRPQDGSEFNFSLDSDYWSKVPKPKDCIARSDYLRIALEEQPNNSPSDQLREMIQAQILDDRDSNIEFLHFRPGVKLPNHLKGVFGTGIPGGSDTRRMSDTTNRFKNLYFVGTIAKDIGREMIGESNFGMIVSLDHSMYFYDHEIDVSQWMLYQMEAECARFGRGLVIGRIFDLDGKLLAICTQEGVIRRNKL
ncbi:thioesterase-like superfamily-domain-containing protein [Phakopsora pachyrhizi]|uniref:Thioesterase-like superfamily-domain-containing protein n=1 Tax=Phakopsora pachyrhizi TaxID=170000 RepID=A0AAV0BFC5_PHAPC|nr:thioesterase-like superfamily-domain-containing protein [Phakopsora pachyrhizi]